MKTNEIIAEWAEYLGLNIKREKSLKAYLTYVEGLIRLNLPVIFELNHFSELVGISAKNLAAMSNHSSSFYREFEIPKRKGGVRLIATPQPSLLHVQRWILHNILESISVDDSVHGFTKGRSVVTNALQHLSPKCLLKMDIVDFFPAIKIPRVIAIFKRCGYPMNVSYYLASLCCMKNALPQGAATSPSLSNIVFKRIDKRLSKLSIKLNLTYTRYADDLTFSGNHISIKFSSYVSSIIEDEGFRVNQGKTTLIRNRGKKIVTGVSVSGREPKLPRETKRRIKQEAYFLIKYGFSEHTKWNNIFDPLYAERLLGKFVFWKQVEPENIYVSDTIEKIKAIQKDLNVLV